MKITRDQLKSLIKECIIEVLADGLGSSIVETANRSAARGSFVPKTSGASRPVANVSPVASQLPKSMISEIAGKNPVMASIFADTAETTLVHQAQAGHSQGNAPSTSGLVDTYGDQAAKMASMVEPTELFGLDAAQKWNHAAFSANKSSAFNPNMIDFDPYAPTPDMKKA